LLTGITVYTAIWDNNYTAIWDNYTAIWDNYTAIWDNYTTIYIAILG